MIRTNSNSNYWQLSNRNLALAREVREQEGAMEDTECDIQNIGNGDRLAHGKSDSFAAAAESSVVNPRSSARFTSAARNLLCLTSAALPPAYVKACSRHLWLSRRAHDELSPSESEKTRSSNPLAAISSFDGILWQRSAGWPSSAPTNSRSCPRNRLSLCTPCSSSAHLLLRTLHGEALKKSIPKEFEPLGDRNL